MAFKRFEDIIAWQKAKELAVYIYGCFHDSRDYGFKDQICRASILISNNIAEGFCRQSSTDFTRFLFYALGSCNEVKSMTYIAHELKYLDDSNKKYIFAMYNEISRTLMGLINKLKQEA